MQRRLSSTLHAAYGKAAWQLMPLSFSLPGELKAWRAWLDERAAAGEDPGPWMLKTAQHLGKVGHWVLCVVYCFVWVGPCWHGATI